MVWFQMESFPFFNKLWGHIWGTLYKNVTYRIEIQNRFSVAEFDGKKYIYLSEVNQFGGTSLFLGVSMLVLCGILILMMIVFVFLYFTRVHKKDIYSTDVLAW